MAEEQNVQAEQQAVDQQADQLAQKALEGTQTEQPTGDQQQETPPPKQPDVQDILRDELGKFRGAFADTYGRKSIEMEQRITDKVVASIQPIVERMQLEEEARVGNLLPEEQVEYWKEVAKQKDNPQQEVEQTQQMSVDNQVLAKETQQLISESGLNINLSDPALWQGYQQGMSVRESLKVAETNLSRLKNPPQTTASPQQTIQPNTQPPPTTQGATQRTAKSVNTISEAATMFADGSINSTQYREMKDQIKQGGSATL